MGHHLLVLILSIPITLLLVRSRRDRFCGRSLLVSASGWQLGDGHSMCGIQVVNASLALPFAVHLALQPITGTALQHLWVFRDAVNVDDFRRLRVRAAIETRHR